MQGPAETACMTTKFLGRSVAALLATLLHSGCEMPDSQAPEESPDSSKPDAGDFAPRLEAPPESIETLEVDLCDDQVRKAVVPTAVRIRSGREVQRVAPSKEADEAARGELQVGQNIVAGPSEVRRVHDRAGHRVEHGDEEVPEPAPRALHGARRDREVRGSRPAGDVQPVVRFVQLHRIRAVILRAAENLRPQEPAVRGEPRHERVGAASGAARWHGGREVRRVRRAADQHVAATGDVHAVGETCHLVGRTAEVAGPIEAEVLGGKRAAGQRGAADERAGEQRIPARRETPGTKIEGGCGERTIHRVLLLRERPTGPDRGPWTTG